MGTPRSDASLTTVRIWSASRMFPGLSLRPATPASSAMIASRNEKWMSATMGTPASRTIIGSAAASPGWGTATRTMSAPWVASAWAWIRVAWMSSVLVVHIDWMAIGEPPPIGTLPTMIFFE